MKFFLAIIFLIISDLSFGQSKEGVTRVLAALEFKYNSDSEIKYSLYKVIKNLDENDIPNQIIVVFKDSTDYSDIQDSLILDLKKIDKIDSINNIFYFESSEKVKLENYTKSKWNSFYSNYDSSCVINFCRDENIKNWFLIVPRGGSYTQAYLYKNDSMIQETKDKSFDEGSPVIDLSNLVNGEYKASFMGCGKGGKICFNIKTIKKISDYYMPQEKVDSIINEIDKKIKDSTFIKYSLKEMHPCGGGVDGYFNDLGELQYIYSDYGSPSGYIERQIYFYKNNKVYNSYRELNDENKKDIIYLDYIMGEDIFVNHSKEYLNFPYLEFIRDVNRCAYKIERDLIFEYKTKN